MLTRLIARQFRNLEPLDLELAAGSHLILGDNGAGKTSLLEAIYLLATTRSFRTTKISQCARHGSDGFVLRGETAARATLELSLVQGERSRQLNGSRSPLAEHLAVLPVIAWTAGDGDVLTGPPAARRRFLDRGVIGLRPAALEVIGRVRQAMNEKRRLLADEGGGRRSHLAAWNAVLVPSISELVSGRAAYVEQLQTALDGVLERCELSLASIELRYRPSPRQALEGADEIDEQLAGVAERELAAGQPLIGPHRDDLDIRWDGHPIGRVASAGERKALALALLAAHGEVIAASGRPPIYLLDDCDTELDRGRLGRLWSAFAGAGQVLTTSNRPAVWQDLAIDHRWRCEKGGIEPEDGPRR